MIIKIKIQNNFNFILDWRLKLKRKFNLAKGQKFKRMRNKINIKIKIIFWLKGKIEKKNHFNCKN